MYKIQGAQSLEYYTVEQWLNIIDYEFEKYSEQHFIGTIYFTKDNFISINDVYIVKCEGLYDKQEFNYIVNKHIRNEKLNILLDI